MIRLKKSCLGFTLAEVLVTLAIIGVVASLTIPALVKSYQKKVYVSSLKKIYSELSQATFMIMADNGGNLRGLCAATNHICLRDKFASFLKTVKKCDASSTPILGNCWHKENKWYRLDGSPLSIPEDHAALISPDGFFMNFLALDAVSCEASFEKILDPILCGRARVDINGFSPPNTVGIDIFDFYILENRILPRGSSPDTEACLPSGWGCAYKVFSEGDMNY